MRALVLSGGNGNGSYQVGVLKKWIYEDKLDYDIFLGTSIGALNGGYLAQALEGDLPVWWSALEDLWCDTETSDVYNRWFFGELAALWKTSVYQSQGVRDFIHSNIDPVALQDSGRKFRCVYVSWRTRKILVGAESDADILDEIYASASYPVFFEPAIVEGELCTDGGVREIAPIGLALDLGADDVDVVVCSNPNVEDDWSPNIPGVLPFALRTVDIMATEILLNDIKICRLKNRLPEYKHVNLRVAMPSKDLGDSFDFNPATTKRRIEIGYADACAMAFDEDTVGPEDSRP